MPVGGDGAIDVRILIDHSALEVFAGGIPLTARVYPTRRDALGVWLSGDAVHADVRAWAMAGAGRQQVAGA